MPKPLQVVAEVNEEDIPRVIVGQTALFRTDAFPDRRLQGKVSEITPMGDVAAKTFRVKMLLPDDTPLKPGMSVEANIVTREKPDALLIPADALQGNAVFVLDGSTARKREVKIGIRGTRKVEVLSGLAEGKRVASPAPTDLKDGERVRVTGAGRMSLILDIALTHVRARVRQTGFAVAGVATGVGFSIMMASLMQGSQDDFTQRLINTLPHITVTDERRTPPKQPAETLFDAAEIHGLTPEARRPGIKNPLAIMAALEAWLPGGVAPSVKVQAIIRYANRDVATSVTGIDPRRESKVSELPKQMRGATVNALYRATNAIIIGDRLSEKIGARIGANVTLQTSQGARISAQVVGFFHTGVRQTDESTAYVLTKTGQILARQTGLINELRVRLRDPLSSREVAARIESDTGYKSVSWQEAYEDLISTFIIRNMIMYAVVGAILLVASFGTYNIISTITHEKARDIAIMKSLGLSEYTVRMIFVLEAVIIGLVGALVGFALGYLLCRALGAVQDHQPVHGFRPPAARLYLRALSALPAWWRWCPRSPPAISRRARPRAATRSRSSGAPHERNGSPSCARRAGDQCADRGAQRHAHFARHRADHAGARHHHEHRRQRIRGDHRAVRLG